MSQIIKAICPICGKEYRYRDIYFMKNYTCPSRDCKEKFQNIKTKIDRKLSSVIEGCEGFEILP